MKIFIAIGFLLSLLAAIFASFSPVASKDAALGLWILTIILLNHLRND
jgi:hypothetical protein